MHVLKNRLTIRLTLTTFFPTKLTKEIILQGMKNPYRRWIKPKSWNCLMREQNYMVMYSTTKGEKKKFPSLPSNSKLEKADNFHNFARSLVNDNKWDGRKIFRTGAFADNSMISPFLIGWAT